MGIDISPDGKFVYAVIRQVNAIVVFARDAADRCAHARPRPAGLRERARPPGRRRAGHGGRVRRGAGDARHHRLTVGPGGTQLYTVSDQKDSIAVLTRNATTGELTPAAGDAQCVAPGGKWDWPDDNNPLANEKSLRLQDRPTRTRST